MNFSPSAVPPEIFAYLSALRFFENGENEYAEAIERSGLVSSEQYLLHLRGGAMYSAGNLESALAFFVKAAAFGAKGLLLVAADLYRYRALRSAYRKLRNRVQVFGKAHSTSRKFRKIKKLK